MRESREAPCFVRRSSMLDVIVIVVTLGAFLLLIGFTIGCERL